MVDQPATRRARRRDVTRRRDVVRRYRIAEHGQETRAPDGPNPGRLERDAVEERRIFYVRGLIRPGERLARRHVERSPPLVAVEHVRVLAPEHVALHGAQDLLLDLGGGWPNVSEKDWSGRAHT